LQFVAAVQPAEEEKDAVDLADVLSRPVPGPPVPSGSKEMTWAMPASTWPFQSSPGEPTRMSSAPVPLRLPIDTDQPKWSPASTADPGTLPWVRTIRLPSPIRQSASPKRTVIEPASFLPATVAYGYDDCVVVSVAVHVEVTGCCAAGEGLGGCLLSGHPDQQRGAHMGRCHRWPTLPTL